MELTNNLKKYVRSLHLNKNRLKYNKFIAEGPKICNEFLIYDKHKIEYLFHTQGYKEVIEKAGSHSFPVIKISSKDLDYMSTLKTPNKVMLILDNASSIESNYNDGWEIHLDRIQDPGNMGAILRIADWFGMAQVTASPDSVDFYNPKVVQSAMGAHNRVKLTYRTNAELISSEKEKIGLVLSGAKITNMEIKKPGIIVIGNESKGISVSLISELTYLCSIAPIGKAESLNASVACGIACHSLINTKG